MKIQLNYDPGTGQISDDNGMIICSWAGLQAQEVKESNASNSADIDELIKLKNAGFDTDDIVELRKKEII